MRTITFLLLTFYSFALIGQIKLTSATDEYFDGTNWTSNYKRLFTYDANGNLLTEEYVFKPNLSIDVWATSSKTINTYNANNKMIEQVYEDWDTSTNTKSYSYKTVYNYNAQNNLTDFIDYKLENNQWIADSKLILSYNSDNQITTGIFYLWNGSSFVLDTDDSERTTLNYNSDNQLYNIVTEAWNGSAWVMDYKTDNTFSNGKLVQAITSTYNGTSWVNDYKIDYTYDSNDNKLSETYSEINNGVWEANYQDTFVYDTTKLLSDFIHPFKDKTGIEYLFEGNFPYKNKLVSSSYSDNNRVIYNYGEATASTKETVLLDFEVYPNPATSLLTIKDHNFTIKKIELYNVLGKKVLNTTENKINIAPLVSGVYLMKIESEEGNFTTKRIVKK